MIQNVILLSLNLSHFDGSMDYDTLFENKGANLFTAHLVSVI